MSSTALHPHLREYRRQHVEVGEKYRHLLDRVTDDQFNFCPAPGRWTIGQNIEHLNLEGAEQVDIIRRIIDAGRMGGVQGDGEFRYSRWGNAYLRFLEPPYRVKIRTLPRYTAAPRLEVDPVARRFFAIKQEVLTLIEEANGLDLARLRAPLPYLKGWNPSLALGQWFAYVAVHERRHLWQIENILESPGYPR